MPHSAREAHTFILAARQERFLLSESGAPFASGASRLLILPDPPNLSAAHRPSAQRCQSCHSERTRPSACRTQHAAAKPPMVPTHQ